MDVSNGSGMITVMTNRTKTKDLKFWNGLEKSFLTRRGVNNVDDREFRIGDETMSCVGGPAPQELQIALKPTMTFSCMSDGRLNIMLMGPPAKIENLVSLISQIRPY